MALIPPPSAGVSWPLLPTADATQDLGDATHRLQDVYVGRDLFMRSSVGRMVFGTTNLAVWKSEGENQICLGGGETAGIMLGEISLYADDDGGGNRNQLEIAIDRVVANQAQILSDNSGVNPALDFLIASSQDMLLGAGKGGDLNAVGRRWRFTAGGHFQLPDNDSRIFFGTSQDLWLQRFAAGQLSVTKGTTGGGTLRVHGADDGDDVGNDVDVVLLAGNGICSVGAEANGTSPMQDFAVFATKDLTFQSDLYNVAPTLKWSVEGALSMPVMALAVAPPAGYGQIQMRDNGAGKVQMVARFPSGAAQVIATEP